MGKASRRRTTRPSHTEDGRQAGTGSVRRPTLRGAALGDRVGGAARDPARRHGLGDPHRGRRHDAGDGLHRAPARLAGLAPQRWRAVRRDPVGRDQRGREPRPRRRAAPRRRRGRGHAGHRRPEPHRRHPATAGHPRHDRPVRRDRPRGVRLLGRRSGPRRGWPAVARAGQRVGHPDRARRRRRVGLLVRHQRAHLRPLGPAVRRGHRHGCSRPAARRRLRPAHPRVPPARGVPGLRAARPRLGGARRHDGRRLPRRRQGHGRRPVQRRRPTTRHSPRTSAGPAPGCSTGR